MDEIEKEGHQGKEVNKDEADEDPLRNSNQIIHGACLQC